MIRIEKIQQASPTLDIDDWDDSLKGTPALTLTKKPISDPKRGIKGTLPEVKSKHGRSIHPNENTKMILQ